MPAPVRRVLDGRAATLRPLGALLIACSALGLVGWIVQVGADVDEVRAGRSTADGARRGVALRRRARRPPRRPRFRRALHGRRQRGARPALPGRPGRDVPGRDGGLRVFSYTDAMPAYVFLPALVLLFGLLILAALYAGFAAARAVGAARRTRRRLGSGDRPGVGDRDVDPHQPRRRPLPRRRRRRLVFGLFLLLGAC